ncbi:MAG TPA: GAF domain-containing SpoIIE family protein phosphatase [Abditibacteriaceae bacterium]|jgi:sigma-B regulation protein RsbU (phosphoserine phosphatase)
MAQISYLMVSLGIFNLLLVAAGLLLTYFDWSAARRREFLYLYFSEDKPGASYFAAARRRRAQYTRLLVAFIILFCAEFAALLFLVTDSNSSSLNIWMQCLRMVVPVLLGAGFLFNPDSSRRAMLDVLVSGFVAAWALFLVGVMSGAFGNVVSTEQVVAIVSSIVRILVVVTLLYALWKRRDVETTQGLLQVSQSVLSVAFGAWLLGPVVSFVASVDTALFAGQIGACIAYGLLVVLIARGMLLEYETVESSRHRLGRERYVIFSFLQRIGAAFTTAVEVEQVLHIILESALETTEASAGAIYLYHAENGLLEPRVVLNFFPPLHVDTPAARSAQRTEDLEEEMKQQRFRLGEGVIGQVAREGRARIVDDVRREGIMLGTTTDFMRNRSMLLVPLKIRDEPLGVMAVLNKQRGSFTVDDQFLLQALADQGALSINNAMLTIEVGKQERLRRELQIARDIQRMLLPERCPIVPGFELAARGSSAYEVGGDYYDFFWVDDDRLGIVVADVSGKGVPAALTVAMMRSVFRTQARGNTDVRDVLSQVNKFMSQDLRSSDFITCVYGILEISTKRFSWARAGHEPVIVAHDDAPTDVHKPDGFALGVIESPTFDEMLEVETIELHSGDRLLIFTDGLTEAMNSRGEEFGMERILQVMSQNVNGHNGTSGTIASTQTAQVAAVAEVPAAKNPRGGLNNSRNSPCDPEPPISDPQDLRSLDVAVHRHVGNEPQSDDLTIVYLSAK